ncbi:hypothetical protein [Tunturibacter empetritectus]|uniref:Uncharacterized protein n=1 Tax=Tunturiibacter empetritectus TaxID=3069691 RepID=A0A7W8IFK7_9BACT|nr:hypothetical protein [Edaphobacter lichenicola]MBB5316261.1 hypothetical protein [Edaphobacter lichenicola]
MVSLHNMVSLRAIVRFISPFLACCFLTVALAQETTPPKVSTKPLTAEQKAVYNAFLTGYQGDSKVTLNVANVTDPFLPDKDDLHGCLRNFPKDSRAMEVHQFADQLANDRIHLVNPEKYKVAQVGDFMQRREDLDSAVQAAIDAGLMSMSEVIFDHTHRLAALNFSFQCGKLCGHGGIVIYELRNGHWSRSKRSCGEWQS